MLEPLLRVASRFTSHAATTSDEEKQGFLKSQRLAQEAAVEISGFIQAGWTETQAADLMETYLRDRGVSAFFHHPFAWFGERTRFSGIANYKQYQPSRRVLQPNEVYILDVAPILNGYVSDIGYTACLGENEAYAKATQFLGQLRKEIPPLFNGQRTGAEVWNWVDKRIAHEGFDNIHKRYPFSVLGHRVHHNLTESAAIKFLHFGWQSYWSLLSRGLFGQLLTGSHSGDLVGLWAIEPHIGTPAFGAKFEEILVVEKTKAYWLEKGQ